MAEVIWDEGLDRLNETELGFAFADKADTIALLLEDPEFFIEFFLPELEWPVPEFHIEIFKRMTSSDLRRMLLAIPRGHAKTQLAKLAVVWFYLFSKHRFAVYLSNTAPIAKNACRDIVAFLQTDNFRAIFGEAKFEKESENEGIWIFELTVPRKGGGAETKRCILRALGSGQQIRGTNIDNERPDIAVVDDLEDIENTATPELQSKLDRWFFGTFRKALRRDAQLIWLGNMLSHTSLLARASQMPRWNPIVLGAIIRDPDSGHLRSLWPELWPISDLIDDYLEYKENGKTDVWFAEMMNMPGMGGHGFDIAGILYMPRARRENLLGTFITIDPAFGKRTVNDSSAISVHGIQADGPPMTLAYVTGKFSEEELFLHTLELAIYWNAWVWGIESVAAQSALITLFRLLATAHRVMAELELVPLRAGARKSERIGAWVGMLKSGTWALPEEDFAITSQLLTYDRRREENDDDLIDSCAYGPQLLEMFFGLIVLLYQNQDPTEIPKITYGRSIADV